ncbi:RluA family pseudouridine synthase [Verminephrobacter aporrectodeae]|uniref:Pseudouridine synthase n=1 Tax=Verminephrobacter aporrectodeae subsp. tuberculatae TaxID=1110392 RepID=A0ABT3KQD6_9BURK|nr:RluA family pseudouridine synthase [Verminephrobacter aporrectodeae]MCW5220503.1 RluA family pseudouridine synthase [Verminephrobacter aporrectodeae subsp. tuberculatae]MCW5255539.1 RluA family pseudouridine synthase [Verminephrobacter aporrectodeae subsp. tuberculatae]MCW5289799.1 RluA family pseudouridine synthase [Verminephrobacter aporrectodeae subsp. tuberculatae]MCW5320523.1 RluA family pseudouridine synthase [Verminephrobacter aporrectodeae subsp. tuberculatae]MCW8163803.1 RluA famil
MASPSIRRATCLPGDPGGACPASGQADAGLPDAEDDDLPADEPQAPDAVESELRAMELGAQQHGARLDRALVDLVPEFSRSYLQQLLAQGLVRLNGRPVCKAATRVEAGDRVLLEMRPTAHSQAFRPEPMAIDVLYEDAQLLVVNKPAGLVVHPAPGNWSATLLNGLLARDAGALLLPRAGIVHRLDKDTSGLMVVARDRATMDALVAAIAQRRVQRQYLALAHGAWTGPGSRSVDAPIGRDPRNRLRMAVVDLAIHAGKSARTDALWLDGTDRGCWLQCTLHTGRTHQIRVHMAFLKHPLVGDSLYGGAPLGPLQRQALHAWRLAFVHPVTGQALEFRAPLPEDMQQALASWGLGYNAALMAGTAPA